MWPVRVWALSGSCYSQMPDVTVDGLCPFLVGDLAIWNRTYEAAAHHYIGAELPQFQQAFCQGLVAASELWDHKGRPPAVPLEDGIAVEEV